VKETILRKPVKCRITGIWDDSSNLFAGKTTTIRVDYYIHYEPSWYDKWLLRKPHEDKLMNSVIYKCDDSKGVLWKTTEMDNVDSETIRFLRNVALTKMISIEEGYSV